MIICFDKVTDAVNYALKGSRDSNSYLMGARISLASESTELHATFETIRLIIFPTAFGRMVSLFLFSEMSSAPQMYFKAAEAADPDRKMLTTDVNDSRQF